MPNYDLLKAQQVSPPVGFETSSRFVTVQDWPTAVQYAGMILESI